jgi:hypothetical protein
MIILFTQDYWDFTPKCFKIVLIYLCLQLYHYATFGIQPAQVVSGISHELRKIHPSIQHIQVSTTCIMIFYASAGLLLRVTPAAAWTLVYTVSRSI